MTITREQAADLRPGDVVEYRRADWPVGTYLRGPLYDAAPWGLAVGGEPIRYDSGGVSGYGEKVGTTLTVISRAPRPLYVNHDRTEPVPGDVARNPEGHVRVCQPVVSLGGQLRWWGFNLGEWGDPDKWTYCTRSIFSGDLTLLVDGETGQVVR